MILKTFDNKEIYVSAEQAKSISEAIANGVKMIQIEKCYYATGAIATITRGGTPPTSFKVQLEGPGLSSEEIEAKYARNRLRLAEMRKNLVSKGVLKA